MKRWQDRGEVLDSDDDESQSQESDQRNPGLLEAARSTGGLGSQHPEAGDGVLQQHGVQNQETTQGGIDRGIGGSSQPAVIADDGPTDLPPGTDDEQLLADSFELGPNQTHGDSAPAESQANESVAEDNQDPGDGHSVSTRAEFEMLSGTDKIHAAQDVEKQTEEPTLGSAQSTAPSSPLTERAISPSPPPGTFRFPSHEQRASRDSSPDQIDEHGTSNLYSGQLVPEVALATPTARRNLRARNEKQLHPYLFDRAQHQQQFRERGMRPIRVDPERREAMETQEVSFSGDEREDGSVQSSMESNTARDVPISADGDEPFSNTEPTSMFTSRPDFMDSDEELPELSTLFRPPPAATAQYGNKRRKLFHPARSTGHTVLQPVHTVDLRTADNFSVPPSPPVTSSDSVSRPGSRSAPIKFRLPRGQTPEALPTPQISSELRDNPAGSVDADEFEDSELPSRRLRTSVQSRRFQHPIAIESPEESSEAESEANIVDQRLQRERKRIKGVLPASWLKIDFRAQQKQASPSPHRSRRQSSPSPPRPGRQRGVAHKISSRTPKSPGQHAIYISDDESVEELLNLSPAAPSMRQSKLQFERERATTAPSDLVDVDRMEVDWIDPMLAGSSRPRSEQRHSRKRQPRITESYSFGRMDFSEEENALRKAAGSRPRTSNSKSKHTRNKTPKRFVAPRLSILDAPEPVRSTAQTTPQFVRLAMRRARQHSDHARHSPTGKHIRLATSDETEDATAVLRSWREGTILPRPVSERESDDHLIDLTSAGPSDVEDGVQLDIRREPLAEIGHNGQQRLPNPLRKHASEKAVGVSTHQSTHGSKMRQTQLRAVSRLNDAQIGKRSVNHESTTNPSARADQTQKRRDLLVHTHQPRYRAAQLESLEQDLDRQHRTAEFEYRMHCLTENIVRPHRELGGGFQLARFLQSDDTVTRDTDPAEDRQSKAIGSLQHEEDNTGTPITLPRRPRKRQPHRIDADAREYRQPSEPLPEVIDLEESVDQPGSADEAVLHGLGPFGTRYATDFDVLPLQLGTYFHETSFIGSGDFAASLNFANRDLDVATGRIRIHIGRDVLEWGAWTEEVASGLSRLPSAVSEALQTISAADATALDVDMLDSVLLNVDYLLRSTVRYFTQCLAFLDPVDRRHCIQALHNLTNDLLEVLSEYESIRKIAGRVLARNSQYILILSRQAFALCNHHTVPFKLSESGRELVLRAAGCLAAQLVPNGLEDLRAFYEENRHASKREAGIRDGDTAICSVVVLHHATRDSDEKHFQFWRVLCKGMSLNVAAVNTVSALDRAWYDVFTILPALEIDVNGMIRTGSRFEDTRQDWAFPRSLVERLLQLYPQTSSRHGSTINDYVRATFTRCAHLVSRWGWWRCDALLGTIFDFFARRGLSQLHNEECRGSPRFLEESNLQGSLEIQPEDRSFHIFLKMLASGLQGMRKHKMYPDKKIGGIAWRFIPNHGRTHRRDVDLRQEDLDSLRNHHDLLCTLYCAAPPDHRLRANLVQNLVDHSISHREACRLNIRAWATLVCFQASTTEPSGRLEEFCTWFRDMMSTTMNQYRLARNEVEQEVASAREQGQLEPSAAIVEDTIIRNQRQIAATLVDLLSALNRALRSSFDAPNAVYLLRGSAFWQVYDIFDPSQRRLYGVLHEALDTIKTALSIQRVSESQSDAPPISDDSQDYGDSTALQELVATQVPLQSDQSIVSVLQPPLMQLVSNVFGADATTEDFLLVKLVDVWAQAVQCTVQNGHRMWSSYISGYTSDAWTQLRDTEQRRKYTPYFLSRIIELGDVDFFETDMLTSWLKSLVDREATLKFQHSLTNAILNRHSREPLLANLPFATNVRGQYDISLQELRQRRLSLISTLLFNIRQRFDNAPHERRHSFAELRQTYASILRQLMQAMKDNYQELQMSRDTDVADAQAQGTYVEFVQQVVSSLQQYTTDICSVDRFFTDSAGFPLPTTDPTYVVGRLKSYVPKLSESRKRKELATFVQAVSERAAVDGQQTYLIDQLGSAMSGWIENDELRNPSLRHVLCLAVFPAYIENALSTAYSWLVAVPVIDACSKMASDLLYSTRAHDFENVRIACDTMGMLLQSAVIPVKAAITHIGRLSLPHVQRTLSAIFRLIESCLTPARFFDDVWRNAKALGRIITLFYEYATFIDARLNNMPGNDNAERELPDATFHSTWPDTLDFVRKQVDDKFNNQWHAHDGHYYVRRGNHSVEVVVHLGDEEKQQLLEDVREFRESYDVIFRGLKRPHRRVDDDCNVGALIV